MKNTALGWNRIYNPSPMKTSDGARRWRVARVLLVFLTFASSATPARGQDAPRVELLGGLSVLESSDILAGAGRGWTAGGALNLIPWLAVEVELGKNSTTRQVGFLDIRSEFLALLAGPRFARSLGTVRPFGRILVGAIRVDLLLTTDLPIVSTGMFDEQHGTVQLGGGVDVRLFARLSTRVAYDFRQIFAGDAFHQHRFAFGAIYHLW